MPFVNSFLFLVVRPGAPLVASLLLVAMPFATSSFLLLLVMPGAPSSILAPSTNFSQVSAHVDLLASGESEKSKRFRFHQCFGAKMALAVADQVVS